MHEKSNINIDGWRDRGRGKKTWVECVPQDLVSWTKERVGIGENELEELDWGKHPTCA